MNAETAKLALQFLQRVNMSGAEVSAYLKVVGELQAIITPPDEEENKVPNSKQAK